MKTSTTLTRRFASALVLATAGLISAGAGADTQPAYPPGMMMQGQPSGGYGPGTMSGGMGMTGGYGPGMMGGGMGMMGGYGPGMMGGGMGMMGGYGPGMMGFWSLNLSKEQRAKINQISDETRRKHWELMGKMQEQSGALRDLYDADKRDAAEIGKAYQKIFDLKRQMIESSVDAHNRMEAILTKEQREQLRKSWPRGGMMWQEP